jgi:phosphopentomutase
VFSRAILIVLDSVPASANCPLAPLYEDQGSNTHRQHCRPGCRSQVPNLASLGLSSCRGAEGHCPGARRPRRSDGWPSARRQGLGHGPLGVDGRSCSIARSRRSRTAFRRTDRRVRSAHRPPVDRQRRRLGHRDHRRARSRAHGDRFPIVYTSADSVFQIAAHEGIVPVPQLYDGASRLRA